MKKFEPEEYHTDPMVNAVLNVAEQLARLATVTNKLLYGLKYSEGEGLSIAEAIEVGSQAVAVAISDATFLKKA